MHDTLQQRLAGRRQVPLCGVVRRLSEVRRRPASFEPALDRVYRVVSRRLDLVGLLVEAAEDHEGDEDSEREKPEQDECRAYGPRDAVPLHLRHERPGDRREDGPEDTGSVIVDVSAEQPGQADEEDRDADEEPGEQPEVAHPDRRGEHP